jgi:predicted naringenin-chalcone synthase
MSSATFPFVLKKLLKKPQKDRLPFAVGLGFGPGLAMEGILLEELL